MKKFKFLFLSMVLALTSINTAAFAEQGGKRADNISISKEMAYYDQELQAYVVSFKINEDKSVDYLNQADVKALSMNNSSDLQTAPAVMAIPQGKTQETEDSLIISPMADYYEYYTFTKTNGPYKYIGSKRKVSADFVAPPGGGSVSKSVSFSVTETYSANVNYANQKSAIQAGAGFSWSKSASVGTTYTVNLRAGESGYLAFSPYYNRVDGTLKQYSNWDGLIGTFSASGFSVMKTYDGEADGLYQFVFTN